MLQELLITFEAELGQAALVPGTGGVFQVRVDGETIWSRKERGRFPELKELKQLVRDRIAPGKDLVHSETSFLTCRREDSFSPPRWAIWRER